MHKTALQILPCGRTLKDLGLLLLVNNLIALILTASDGRMPLWQYLIICNAVGFSIDLIGHGLKWLARGRLPNYVHFLVATPLGMLCGFKFATLLGTADVVSFGLTNFSTSGRWVLLSVVLLAFAASGFFYVYHRGVEARIALETERRQRAEAEEAQATAQLGLLQAQIEPHFLFNTLANVQSLIERNPTAARAMLEQLNRYLRASLTRTRQPTNTLAEELQLVSALLEIARMRLGERLSYRIDLPQSLHTVLLPPLLLQPLVENALEHGIEPAVAGGEILIEGHEQDGMLVLRVHDSGLGLCENASGDGVGLANIRARLHRLYGAAGRLALYANAPSGVIAELILPCRSH
ncbi:Sensor histidine kinase YpdA [Andreprevotia sp. IGB-42]|uniref:sensor histidine kinase n=1 Tax=Andreprevotia sp. IGB-42 TaxID=2497473 RepID=UPI00135AAC90|nr:histidine kinase [Andreprevotia sp. IGB-42]KAF0813170.1 Sensor histidine kinase YpdA [Andreprevotia sp. IGB-42]